MVQVLNQLVPIRDWNETFSRDKLCHICVLLDFCHLSLKYLGTSGKGLESETIQVSISSGCS